MDCPDLKPCPFCGSEAKFIEQPTPCGRFGEPEYDVACSTPGCFVYQGADWYLDMKTAADMWNDRGDPVPAVTRIEVRYADGKKRLFFVSQKLEARILAGDYFTFSTIHPRTGHECMILRPGDDADKDAAVAARHVCTAPEGYKLAPIFLSPGKIRVLAVAVNGDGPVKEWDEFGESWVDIPL